MELALPMLLGHAAAFGSSPALVLLLSQPQESSPEPASRSLAEQEPLWGKPW